MTKTAIPNEAPKAIAKDKVSKITSGIKKAGNGKVEALPRAS